MLLLEALATFANVRQTVVCRTDSPLHGKLAGIAGLDIVPANHQLMSHFAVGRADVVHAHEAKAVHWAWLHWRLRHVPYIITRRVDTPVGDKLLNRWCYRQAARRVAISEMIRSQLLERDWGPVDLVPSAYSGIASDPAETRAFRSRFPECFIVGHVGALVDRHKGQRVLLEVARRLEKRVPKMVFVFLGEGVDGDALREESRDQKNVFWLGFKENIIDYIAGFDVFAFPSRNEGLGSVLLDVMANEIPVVASRVGGIPDIITHENTGLLFNESDAGALAEALERLYRDNVIRTRLAANGRLQTEAYSPRQMAANYRSLYTQAVRS